MEGCELANTRSAMKAARQNERRRLRNRRIKSSTRTYLKRARLAVSVGDAAAAKAAVKQAVVALDKAAQKGVIHKNKAARVKSRLMKSLNRMMETHLEAE